MYCKYTEPSGDQRSGARYLHNVNGVSNLQGESEKCIVNGGGEGEHTDSLQQKKATSPGNSWIQEGVDASQNGAVVTPAAGATAGHSGNVCRLAGAQDLTENGSSGVNGSGVECTTETPEDPSPSRSTVKPLHTNSLTGDAGQEFLIKNTFLYYLLTFGTELCNEPFYVTFFPFFIWNVDAYGSRRLIVVWVFQPALDLIDNFNLKYCYAPLIIISLHLGMGLFSFTLDTWSTSRGNTTQILGTGAGVALASHLNHYLGQMPDPPLDQLPLSTLALRTALLAVAMLRFCLGMLVLLANRALMKVIIIHLACRISGILSGDVRKAWQHMEVELPYRYIMYGTVGFNALFVVPQLLTFLQLA
ncbi:sphingosine-1-phosphate phosphatase 1-like [Coregonus clupeaformis]|uniref:sphingosine-1-phosphate phosphatase 1-like n=1 Tax=Coregonus clupeaformis TaxID=59861 RepID=UPI001E1C9B99|nr:sphingosine-1-phosphate phosphatase 1-like [Coregonus clupeaformis]